MLDALGTALQQVVLAEHLHSDNLLRASVPRHHHTPELALAEDTAEGKVLDAGLPRFVRHLQAGPFPSRPVLGVVLERTWSGTRLFRSRRPEKLRDSHRDPINPSAPCYRLADARGAEQTSKQVRSTS